MSAILLGWNPAVWSEWNYDQVVDEVRERGALERRWSVGNHVNITPGADARLYRQGRSEPGLLGHGIVRTRPCIDVHYADQTKTSHYVHVLFDKLLPIENWIRKEELIARVPKVPWNSILQSGWFVGEANEEELRSVWTDCAQ
jgi:hypothetical protein